jgi:hypothetical protein
MLLMLIVAYFLQIGVSNNYAGKYLLLHDDTGTSVILILIATVLHSNS